jgi:hypothetical protein
MILKRSKEASRERFQTGNIFKIQIQDGIFNYGYHAYDKDRLSPVFIA